MTVLATRPRRGLRPPAAVLALALVAAVVAGLFLLGVLPADKWRPFLQSSTWLFLGRGLVVTLQIGGAALVLSLIVGFVFAIGRLALAGPLRWPVVTWIELVRATPVLAILLTVYLGLRRLDVEISFIQAAILGLTIYNSAVLAEIFRAGILSIPRGEVEAARSLGLSYPQAMRYVIVPQAVARMMPAIVSQLITLIKDTTLASVISVRELLSMGKSFWVFNFNLLETAFVLLCIYFAINFPLSLLSRRLEARQPREERVRVGGEEDQLPVAEA